MQRILVVICNNESSAFQCEAALHRLADEGSIVLGNSACIGKDSGGELHLKQADVHRPCGATPKTVGTLLEIGRVSDDFIDEASSATQPNQVAVVAEIDEEWSIPVDTWMEALGGRVHRGALVTRDAHLRQQEIAAKRARIADIKNDPAKTTVSKPTSS